MSCCFLNRINCLFCIFFFYFTGLTLTCSMIPRTSIVLCAVIFFAVSLCDSFSKPDESELKRDPKIAGIEDTGVGWGEKENFEDVNKLDGLKTSKYGMERDGK